MPLALSDEELDTLYRLSPPLPPADRGAFLKEVAERLREVEVRGPGIVTRVAAQVQGQYFRPPDIDTRGRGRRMPGVGKYA